MEVTMANESAEQKSPEGEQDRPQSKEPSGDAGEASAEKNEAPAEEGGPDRGSSGAALQRPPSDS
jgi:hypothetical protein